MDACTIIARNYLPYARVLAESLTAVHPDARVTVLVVDGGAEPSDEALFRPLGLEDILADPDERRRLTFIYDVTELATAVKPLLLRHLLAEGADAILYFDPDIEVFASVDGVWRLAMERGIVLTPHILSPIPDDGFDVSDLAVLRAGVFNLGFIGLGRGTEDFLEWWSGRLRRHCLSDTANGMFVDQRWVDYVAGMFPHGVVRDPGCNVAYWNLHERRLTQTAGGDVEVNGGPLRFYHFSGFDPEAPYLLSRHQGKSPRILLGDQPALQELCEAYAAKLRRRGHRPGAVAYGFATLPDGTPIDPVMRRLFRRALLEAERARSEPPPSPFTWDRILDWLNAPAPEAPRLSRYLFELYQQRADIQRTFPSPWGDGAEAYVHWVQFDPWANESIPAALRPNGSCPKSAPEARAPFADGINVAGYFKAELGVGEVARLVVSAAREGGIPVFAVNNDRTLSRQEDGLELATSGTPHRVTLICANADECPRAVDALPREMTENCHRIGLWFWETERLPVAHAAAAHLLDEIWVATDYVAAAVRATVAKPVHVCPIPVSPRAPVVACRADLGLPEGFVFLFMFDYLSHISRKNPIGLVEAFCRAFRPGEGPTLVLKSINGHLWRGALEAVRAATAGRRDIITRDGYLPPRARDALMSSCDCYVSLHRSEGFGLTLAEAMAFAKPTIATAYSGNLAFMTPENSFLVPCSTSKVPAGCEPYPKGDSWAEPDVDVAASLMRLVYENPALARDRGRRAREHVSECLSPARTIAFIRKRLAAIAAGRSSPEAGRGASAEVDLVDATLDGRCVPVDAQAQAPVPAPSPADAARDLLAEQLALAQRDLQEAEKMLATGIPFRTPSRFGWPGRLLRTAVLRLLRPYAQFEVRAQRCHLQSTIRILECLRRLDGASAPPCLAIPGRGSAEDAAREGVESAAPLRPTHP